KSSLLSDQSDEVTGRSRFVHRTERRERIAARDSLQCGPASANDAVARDRDLGVAAARRREAAPQPDARCDGRQRPLVDVNPGKQDRLRVHNYSDSHDSKSNTTEGTERRGAHGFTIYDVIS